MDITKGVWNISLDTHAIKSNIEAPLDCVLEICSNLVTSYKYTNENSDTYESTPAILGHMYAFSSKKSFDHFDKKWFTVDPVFGPVLRLIIKQNALFKVNKIDLSFELTILFQRIK